MREWLEAQNWQVVDVKAPNRKNNPWTFRGKSSRAFSYQLDGYDDQYILIRRWEKKRPADDDAKPLAGSQWWSKMSYYEDEEKEDPIEDMVFLPFGGPLKLPRRSRTLQRMLLWKVMPMAPRRPKLMSQLEVHHQERLQNMRRRKRRMIRTRLSRECLAPPFQARKPRSWTQVAEEIVDGGLWHLCVASINQSGRGTDEDIVGKLNIFVKSMQAKVVTYVRNYQDQWSEAWAPDPQTHETIEGGKCPTTVKEYLEAIQPPFR